MKIRPTKDSLLVEPLKALNDTVRGIHIPEAHREKQPSIDCIVLAKGPKATEDVKIGDRVLIGRHCGTEITKGTTKLKLVASSELLAIIE
jgi:co-chaperonin GroES (HSP10)